MALHLPLTILCKPLLLPPCCRPRFHVRIADFGLARMLGADSSIAVSKVTNPRWSAPEVIRSSAVSRSADVFSYGVVMWEMLTWEQPYEDMMSIQVGGVKRVTGCV